MLCVTFVNPGCPRMAGLLGDQALVRRRALQWAERHNGRSGRTARQFADHLEGELGLAARS